MTHSQQFENWREQLRADGITLRLGWESPRWKGDTGGVQFYTIHREKPTPPNAPLCCIVTHYGPDDGFSLWIEPGGAKLEDCTAAIQGERIA